MITLKSTMSMAPSREPAVRPMGRNGTAGNTARIQNTANDAVPSTTFNVGSIAIASCLLELRLSSYLFLREDASLVD